MDAFGIFIFKKLFSLYLKNIDSCLPFIGSVIKNLQYPELIRLRPAGVDKMAGLQGCSRHHLSPCLIAHFRLELEKGMNVARIED